MSNQENTYKNSYTAVICPQCGSNQATLLEDDQYMCNSCQTIFSLDKKKVTVEVKHTYNDTTNLYYQRANIGKIWRYIIIGFFAFSLIPALIAFISSFFQKKSSNSSYSTYSTSTYTSDEDKEIKETQVIITDSGPQIRTIRTDEKGSYPNEEQKIELIKTDIHKKVIETIVLQDYTKSKGSFTISPEIDIFKDLVILNIKDTRTFIGFDRKSGVKVFDIETFKQYVKGLPTDIATIDQVTSNDIRFLGKDGNKYIYSPYDGKFIKGGSSSLNPESNTIIQGQTINHIGFIQEEGSEVKYSLIKIASTLSPQDSRYADFLNGNYTYVIRSYETWKEDPGYFYKSLSYGIQSYSPFLHDKFFFSPTLLYRDNDKLIFISRADPNVGDTTNTLVITALDTNNSTILYTKTSPDTDILKDYINQMTSYGSRINENNIYQDTLYLVKEGTHSSSSTDTVNVIQINLKDGTISEVTPE